MTITLLSIFFLGVPIFLTWAAKQTTWIDKVGIVTLCYVAGILIGNIPGVHVPEQFAQDLMGALVALSIPLLLFSSNIRVWRQLGPRLLIAFLACVISACIAAAIGTWLFKDSIDDLWKFAAMLVGVYTGTTANLNAIGISLGVEHEAFVLINGAEMLFGGAYLLLLLTAARRLFSLFLKTKDEHNHDVKFTVDEKVYWKTAWIPFLLSVVILASAFGLAQLIIRNKENDYATQTVILLTITTLGLIGSTNPRIHNLQGSFGLGNYLMYVFCVVVGSLADVSRIFGTAPAILGFVFTVMTLAILIHCLFCRVLRIDTDSFIISSTAGIQGPAFIAPVTKAIGHQSLIPIGLALALLGLAIGNYVGLGASFLLRLI